MTAKRQQKGDAQDVGVVAGAPVCPYGARSCLTPTGAGVWLTAALMPL